MLFSFILQKFFILCLPHILFQYNFKRVFPHLKTVVYEICMLKNVKMLSVKKNVFFLLLIQKQLWKLIVASGDHSPLRCVASLWSTGSRCAGFSSCSTCAQQSWCAALLLRGMWSLFRPRIEVMFPALAGKNSCPLSHQESPSCGFSF